MPPFISDPTSSKISSTLLQTNASLSPHQLTQDEISFIVRTETSSWHAQREPARAHEFVAEIGMEPRLHRRPVTSDGGTGSRPSTGSSWTAGRRTLSWSGAGNGSRTLMDPQHLLNAGPKKTSLALRAEMPSPSVYSYGSGNGNGNGKGDGQRRPSSSRRPQRSSRGAAQMPAPGPPLRNYPGEAFRSLPKEILIFVIEELRKIHLESEEKKRTCPTCYLRDLCSLALTNRQLYVATQEKMYETIVLAGPDSTSHIKKRFRMNYGTRLKLLRRTLRGNEELAELVKSLRVPTFTEAGAVGSKKDCKLYEDIVASVVMACPNLERLLGFYPQYDYEFSRITQALSMRKYLAEHLWNIDAKADILPVYVQAGQSDEQFLSEEAHAFVSYHSRWRSLITLAIHCTHTSTFDASILRPLLSFLPSLRHLALSSLSLPDDFILSLPPLSSLHLSNIPTISARTLNDLSRTSVSASLSSLTLASLPPEVLTLPILTRLLSSMPSLARLSISSCTSPALPTGVSIFLHPYLASSSLEFLHWDVPPSPWSADRNDASFLLAKAIATDGFPALRRLRAPRDVDGTLQHVCKPSRGFDIPIAPLSVPGGGNSLTPGNGRALASSRRRKDSVSSTSSAASGGSGASGGVHTMVAARALREARQAAQARIDIARLRPRWKIVCEDWSAKDKIRVTAKFEVGGFVGKVGSQVVYWLEDDEIGGIESLVRGTGVKEECNGSWNTRKDGKKGWGSSGVGKEWHTPRERGRRNEGLDGLF